MMDDSPYLLHGLRCTHQELGVRQNTGLLAEVRRPTAVATHAAALAPQLQRSQWQRPPRDHDAQRTHHPCQQSTFRMTTDPAGTRTAHIFIHSGSFVYTPGLPSGVSRPWVPGTCLIGLSAGATAAAGIRSVGAEAEKHRQQTGKPHAPSTNTAEHEVPRWQGQGGSWSAALARSRKSSRSWRSCRCRWPPAVTTPHGELSHGPPGS